MTTVTVVADDRRLIVDGEMLEFDFSIDPEIWAIQWNGAHGHIEYRDGRMPLDIADEKSVTPWISLHAQEKERRRVALEKEAASRERDPVARKVALAAIRWEKETGGVVINGVRIDTSRESQNMIDGAYSYASRHLDEMIDFKSADGWISLNAPTVILIADAVAAHVQRCYTHERRLSEEIDRLANDAEALAALDLEAGWPE